MPESILRNILEKAVDAGASDVHIKEDSPVCYRIDGALLTSDYTPDNELLSRFIHEVSTDQQLADFKLSGDLDLSHAEEDVGRFRVNIHRQRGLISITFRHVKNKILDFKELGLPDIIERISEEERGIIILTGTTGSGKSTTLASMLQHINQKFQRHIITIEDPIEYEFHDEMSFFEQREVGIDTISFASALKHSLRQDPDIIMVGEMRDRESFEAALQAADTGHLVMTTLHASNATQTINRILDFYPHVEQPPIREALSLNLRAVISQRLIPKAFGEGRAPGCEIMINTPIISKLIDENKLDKLQTAVCSGTNEGMQSFNQCLLNLINNGVVAEEDAMKASSNTEELRMMLSGIKLHSGGQIIG